MGLACRACAAAQALRLYDGPTCFAIPGNHDWIDGLETYQRHIQHKAWLGGWLLPQVILPCLQRTHSAQARRPSHFAVSKSATVSRRRTPTLHSTSRTAGGCSASTWPLWTT